MTILRGLSFCVFLAEALKIEKISLQHIQDLLHRVEEILGLWKVLVDHQFHAIAEVLSKVHLNVTDEISVLYPLYKLSLK